MKILCVHGLGDHRHSPWEQEWGTAIGNAWQLTSRPEVVFRSYDPIFEEVEISFLETTMALKKLAWSGVSSLFTRRGTISKGVSHWLRWAAGYAVAWVEDDGFQTATRAWFLRELRKEKPDVVLAHSLGSLVTYNALAHPDALKAATKPCVEGLRYVTLGSQIGNPFVRRNLEPGRIERLPVHSWTHLYNEHDSVFTAPVLLYEDNFLQIETPFDLPRDLLNHAAPEYIVHPSARHGFWSALAVPEPNDGGGDRGGVDGGGDVDGGRREGSDLEGVTPGVRAFVPRRMARSPRRRAVLVGINDYPDPEQRLEGCVNDVFLVSSVLQERGFRADEIRTCLDWRATAEGIFDRLDWLLDDPVPGDFLFFYYSGHGTRMPAYGYSDEPDRMEETLVPHDFDWSAGRAVRDDDIFDLYSQLPWETTLVLAFDCCHSGGVHRDGAPRARGITPPDDIRHRALRWDADEGMWVPRHFVPVNPDFSNEEAVLTDYFGEDRSTIRLGRGSRARTLKKKRYEVLKRRRGRVGPYLPTILEACAEHEYAYEYRHGVTSYGAFTYALARHLRADGSASFRQIVDRTGEQLERLGYAQAPQVLGPSEVVDAPVPFSEDPQGDE